MEVGIELGAGDGEVVKMAPKADEAVAHAVAEVYEVAAAGLVDGYPMPGPEIAVPALGLWLARRRP
jgi:hypothetical protein